MDTLTKLLGRVEDEKAQKMIAEEAERVARQQIAAAIRAGETTGDYVKDYFLIDGPNEDSERVYRELQSALAAPGMVGQLVMVVERKNTYPEVVAGSNEYIHTQLTIGVLTEPRFYINLDEKDVVRYRHWCIPTAKRVIVAVNDNVFLQEKPLSAGFFQHHVLRHEVVEGFVPSSNGNPGISEKVDYERRYGESPKDAFIVLRPLTFVVGDAAVALWAYCRGKKRREQLKECCELLQHSLSCGEIGK